MNADGKEDPSVTEAKYLIEKGYKRVGQILQNYDMGKYMVKMEYMDRF